MNKTVIIDQIPKYLVCSRMTALIIIKENSFNQCSRKHKSGPTHITSLCFFVTKIILLIKLKMFLFS